MTNSWNPSLGIDTSKTNYLQTEVDMTESINKQIDENTKLATAHFDRLIKMSNDSIKARSDSWKELLSFTKDGVKFAKWARDKADAKAAIENYYDEDKYQHRFKEELETDIIEGELDQQEAVNYEAAGEIESLDPALSHDLKLTGSGRAAEKELLEMALNHSAQFFERAKGSLEVEVAPGVWKKWSDTDLTPQEKAIISKEIDEVFITSIQNQGISERLMNKYLLHPMLKQHKDRLKNRSAEEAAAFKEADKENRRYNFVKDFNLQDEPGSIIETFIQKYNGYHGTSSGMLDKGYVLAKKELQDFIITSLENGDISWEDAERSLNFELTPNDGGKRVPIRDYLPQFAGPIQKAINKAKNDAYKQARIDKELAIRADVDPILEKWRQEGPPDEEQVHKAMQTIAAKHGEVPTDLANYASKQDIADADIEFELKERWVNGEEILPEDLDGISGAETKAKWMKRVKAGGLTQEDIKERNADITAVVNERTFEEDLDKAKTFKWRTIYKNATNRYNDIYRKERSQGQTHEDAKSIALQETISYIQTEEAATRTKVTRNESRADSINAARAAILKDNSVIDSSDLWPGEEAELKAALRYVKTGKGSIPEYYRSFPNVNLTAYELMQRRLAATGMIKPNEVETIPERELDPEQQDLLLNKPSAARTNRALLDLYGVGNIEELVELTGADSVEELLEVLRVNTQRNNQTAGWEISQVNIDPELEEEHTQVVGEQSTFMRLPTMLPGVAKAYVEDTYNV